MFDKSENKELQEHNRWSMHTVTISIFDMLTKFKSITEQQQNEKNEKMKKKWKNEQ